MDRETAKQTIKQQEPDFLQRAKKSGYVCPKCGNGSGKDGDGIAKHNSRYKCFNCGLYEDIIGLWKISQDITDDREAFKTLYEHYNIALDETSHQETRGTAIKEKPTPQIEKTEKTQGDKMTDQEINFTDFFLQANKDIEKTDYHRGLSLETLNRFCIGYVENWRHPKTTTAPASPRLIIPISEYSYIARDTRETLTDEQEKYKKQKVKGKEGARWFFNIKSLEAAKQPIIIVEGEIDALSIIEAGGEAVALGSTANTHSFIEYVKSHRPSQPFILSLDNDTEKEDGSNPGQEAQQRLVTGLKENNIKYYVYNVAGKYKDANERLQADRAGFISEVEKAEHIEREEYIKENAVINYIDAFTDGVFESIDTPYISTGFGALDEKLDGGLYEGLYIIGAISSLGKTTLVLQIADQIAQDKIIDDKYQAGQDVLIFSLEMAKTELMSKSISRHTFIEALEKYPNDVKKATSTAKTARGITTGKRWKKYSKEEIQLIDTAISKYSEYAHHLYISEGMGNIGVNEIRETVKKHITLTGNKPVVIVDYLQIIAPENPRATDKQNTDKTVLELKRISRDYKIPVIAISSFNRASYKDKVTMEAFKESGAIEYSSDVLFGLQLKGVEAKDFDVDKAKRATPREIELVILKNRNGATGNKISFEYHTLFNYFKETGTGNAWRQLKDWNENDFKRV